MPNPVQADPGFYPPIHDGEAGFVSFGQPSEAARLREKAVSIPVPEKGRMAVG